LPSRSDIDSSSKYLTLARSLITVTNSLVPSSLSLSLSSCFGILIKRCTFVTLRLIRARKVLTKLIDQSCVVDDNGASIP